MGVLPTNRPVVRWKCQSVPMRPVCYMLQWTGKSSRGRILCWVSLPACCRCCRSPTGKSSRLKLELIGMDLEARTERLGEFICAKLSNVLKVEPNQIPYERPMTELGLDSLSAFELKNRIEGELDMTIPISKFLRAPTIVELSTVVSSEIEKPCPQSSAKRPMIRKVARPAVFRQIWTQVV